MRYLLKNGTVVSGEKSEQMDILIEGEKIAAVGHDLQAEDAKVIDADQITHIEENCILL